MFLSFALLFFLSARILSKKYHGPFFNPYFKFIAWSFFHFSHSLTHTFLHSHLLSKKHHGPFFISHLYLQHGPFLNFSVLSAAWSFFHFSHSLTFFPSFSHSSVITCCSSTTFFLSLTPTFKKVPWSFFQSLLQIYSMVLFSFLSFSLSLVFIIHSLVLFSFLSFSHILSLTHTLSQKSTMVLFSFNPTYTLSAWSFFEAIPFYQQPGPFLILPLSTPLETPFLYPSNDKPAPDNSVYGASASSHILCRLPD